MRKQHACSCEDIGLQVEVEHQRLPAMSPKWAEKGAGAAKGVLKADTEVPEEHGSRLYPGVPQVSLSL